MLTRIISGVIGIGAAACVIQYGGWLFAIAVLMLVLIAWYEFSKAFAAKGIRVGYLTGAAMIFLRKIFHIICEPGVNRCRR